jgi:signal transduction histidine kinase
LHSLFAKIFVCTLVIYPVSRGLGFLMLYLLGASLPPAPPQRPDVLQQVLPLYAEMAMASLEKGGDRALTRFIDGQQTETGLQLHFGPISQGDCHGMPVTERPVPGQTIVAAVTATSGAAYCLTAIFKPPVGPGPAFMTLALLPVELACWALVSFLLARYLARPLRDLHSAAIAFADGDLSARGRKVNAGRRDEVAELVRAFNRMADHISALIRAQQQFVADVSHEIKSPLARLSLAAALARRSAAPVVNEQFDRLEREIMITSNLVRELQVLASLDRAGALPRREILDLADLLTAAVDNVVFEREGRPHGIRLTAPSEPVIMLGDPGVLQRALENVLRNALFYTPEGTEVEMTVARHGGFAHIEVRDHGPGVPEAALPHLFDPFYRVDESRSRNTGGVGIGLAIFARAVTLHHGMASAANVEPSGLRISIDLPLAEVDHLRAAASAVSSL